MTTPKNIYIGNRYVPKHGGTWDNTKNTAYESLIIVLWEGNSFTSKQSVPKGIDITNNIYWVKSADYNEQLSIYQQNVNDYHQFMIEQLGIIDADITKYKIDTTKLLADEFLEYKTIIDIDIFVNAMYINVKNLPIQYISAKGDGLTDDTQSFKDAISYATSINNKKIYVPKGVYMINGVVSTIDTNNIFQSNIIIPSNFEIWLNNEATLKVITNSSFAYSVFKIVSSDNIYIHGGNIEGDRLTHNFTPTPNPNATHEFGFGICALNCNNITIIGVKIKNCTGDGIYIGGIYPTTSIMTNNILIENIIIDNVRRNGITIGHGDNIKIKNCTIINTNGTAPQSAIDIEGEGADYGVVSSVVTNVIIENCFIKNNTNYGISLVNCSKIKIIKCQFENQNYGVREFQLSSNIQVCDNSFSNSVGFCYAMVILSPQSLIKGNIINNEIIILSIMESETLLKNILITKNILNNGSSILCDKSFICENVIINGNIINDSIDTAISCGYHGKIDGIIISDNTINNCSNIAITLLAQCGVIENNKIINCSKDGISLYAECKNIIIKDNYIRNWGKGDTVSDKMGITSSSNCNYLTILNNILELTDDIIGKTNSAIEIFGNKTFISGNRVLVGLTKCIGYGIYVSGTDIIIINNDIRSCAVISSIGMGVDSTVQQTSQNYI